MSVEVRRIGHIGLLVRDLDAMENFYGDVMGFTVSDRHQFPDESPFREGSWMRCDTDHHVLSMFDLRDPDEAAEEGKGRHFGLHHFAFEMPSYEALTKAVKMVYEKGLDVQGERTGGPGNQIRFYFWDPEGNLIELYWALDQIGWDGRTRDYPPIRNIDIKTFDIVSWLESKRVPEVKT